MRNFTLPGDSGPPQNTADNLLKMKKYEHYNDRHIDIQDQKALISVCVAVYNSVSYLDRSISSILAQTYRNLEIILVDDGSTDGSGEKCDEYAARDDRVRVIHKSNGGLYTSRNTGIENAGGEYICFLDGDDYIDPDMYERMLGALLAENADLCAVRYRLVYEDGGVDDRSTDMAIVYSGMEMLEQFLREDERILIQNCAWNKLYRRSVIGELRFPDRWYEDMLYTPKLLAGAGKCVYLDKAGHNYLCNRSTSIMNKGINSHIFTDLIPNLYDRGAFLDSIDRHDLACLSDYRLYKKLLELSTQVYRSHDGSRREYLDTIDRLIRSHRDRFDEVYSVRGANANEYRKMKIYLRSPFLYHIVMRINDSVIIPLKQQRINRK